MTLVQSAKIRQSALALISILLGVTLCSLVLLECVEIALRYGFSTTLNWATDISKLLLLLLGWLGAGYLWIARSHLVVDLFQGKLTEVFRLIDIAVDLLVLVGIVWLAPKVLNTVFIYSNIIMPSLEVPASVHFIPLVIGLSLMGLGAVLNLLDAILKLKNPNSGVMQ